MRHLCLALVLLVVGVVFATDDHLHDIAVRDLGAFDEVSSHPRSDTFFARRVMWHLDATLARYSCTQ